MMMEYAPAKPVKNMQEMNPFRRGSWNIVRKMNIWSRSEASREKNEIFRTISQPGALSADIPANQMLLIYFTTHLLNFVSKVD